MCPSRRDPKQASDWPTSAALGAALGLLFVAVSALLLRMEAAPGPGAPPPARPTFLSRAFPSQRWLRLRKEFPSQRGQDLERLRRAAAPAGPGPGPPRVVALFAPPGAVRTLGCFCRALERLLAEGGGRAAVVAEGTPVAPEPRVLGTILAAAAAASGGGGAEREAAALWEALRGPAPPGPGADLIVVGLTADAVALEPRNGTRGAASEWAAAAGAADAPWLQIFALNPEPHIEEGGFVC